jgi:predicted nucleic acid-binding protein
MDDELVCVDAGLVVRWVVFPDDANVQRVWQAWLDNSVRLISPALLFYEVTNVLHRYQFHDLLSPHTGKSALKAALALPIELSDDRELHLQTLDLASRYHLPAAYDAHYLALAERFNAVLYTTDQKLVNALGDKSPVALRCIR